MLQLVLGGWQDQHTPIMGQVCVLLVPQEQMVLLPDEANAASHVTLHV